VEKDCKKLGGFITHSIHDQEGIACKDCDQICENKLTDQESTNQVLEKWYIEWAHSFDSEENQKFSDGDLPASAMYYAIEHAAEILAEIKQAGESKC
jgi:hypothetical protein